MEGLIRKDNMAVQVEAEDWEDAVRKVGSLLLRNGLIKETYIDNMISSVKELGPYIVLTRGLALAHAAPGDAVNETSLSVMTLAEPVSFGSPNDPVGVMMCLACKDNSEHMETLRQVASKLMEKDIISRLQACKDTDELYQLLIS